MISSVTAVFSCDGSGSYHLDRITVKEMKSVEGTFSVEVFEYKFVAGKDNIPGFKNSLVHMPQGPHFINYILIKLGLNFCKLLPCNTHCWI